MELLILLVGVFGAGLLCGWFFLPEPAFMRNWFVKIGIARPVTGLG